MNIEIKDFEKERVVYLSEEITNSSLVQLKRDFNKILQSDETIFQDNLREIGKLGFDYEQLYTKSTKKPEIELNITSPGGGVYCALGMYDFIRSLIESGVDIVCNINGYTASAATIVMLACDKRYATLNTSFMVHSLSGFNYGKIEDLKDNLEECNRLNKILYNIYLSRTNLKEDKLKEIETLKKDWWLNVSEALQFGLITRVK